MFYDLSNASKFGNTESRIHHELHGSKALRENEHIESLVTFMNNHGNPFILIENHNKLKNFVTQIYAEDDNAEKHLQFLPETELCFTEFHKKNYVDKSALIIDKIKIYNLLPLVHVSTSKDLSKKEVTKNEKISRLAIR